MPNPHCWRVAKEVLLLTFIVMVIWKTSQRKVDLNRLSQIILNILICYHSFVGQQISLRKKNHIFGNIILLSLCYLVMWDMWDSRRPMLPTIPPSPPHPTTIGLISDMSIIKNLKEAFYIFIRREIDKGRLLKLRYIYYHFKLHSHCLNYKLF